MCASAASQNAERHCSVTEESSPAEIFKEISEPEGPNEQAVLTAVCRACCFQSEIKHMLASKRAFIVLHYHTELEVHIGDLRFTHKNHPQTFLLSCSFVPGRNLSKLTNWGVELVLFIPLKRSISIWSSAVISFLSWNIFCAKQSGGITLRPSSFSARLLSCSECAHIMCRVYVEAW